MRIEGDIALCRYFRTRGLSPLLLERQPSVLMQFRSAMDYQSLQNQRETFHQNISTEVDKAILGDMVRVLFLEGKCCHSCTAIN